MSGKPAFTFCDFAGAASVTATDTLSGTDPNNVLLATEDTVWSPADAVGIKEITLDLINPTPFNSTSFLGDNLDGVKVLTSTSTDNFVTDQDLSLNNDIIVNGDFATGDFTGWTVTETNQITITADVTGATFTAAGADVEGTISQQNVVTGETFLLRYTIVSIDANLAVLSLVPGDTGTPRLTTGTFTEFLTPDQAGTEFSLLVAKFGGDPIAGAAVKITDIQLFEFSELSTENNAAIISHVTTAADRYVRYTIGNPSTSLQIAHICPDTLVEQPFLENDWGSEGVAPTFNNLISTGGLFLGNNQVRTMRDISIEFGELTDTEYNNTVKPWVDSRIKVAKPFFFIPDVDNLDEVYFVWLEDNVGFTAPLRQGIRTVAPVAAKTRIA